MILKNHSHTWALQPYISSFALAVFNLSVCLLLFSVASVCASLPPTTESSGSLLNLDLRVFVAAKPINLILVEKDKQRLRVLQHDGKLKIIAEYHAATGENGGPKEIEGDSKTPEGIYFITKKYTDSKITIFGKRAFQLNYPNVFDHDAGKEGNGIFVHGTNKELISNSTNGCITLNNENLEDLVQYLPLDTIPVVVVSSLHSLGLQQFADNRIGSFAFNHFERAKSIMLPAGLDWQQVFFESLYLINLGKHTAAVGEYRSFASPDGPDGGFVRSYIEYDEQNGWLERQSFRQEKRQKLDLQLQSQADMFLQMKTAQRKSERVSQQFWQGREAQYLQWYKQSLAGDERLSQKAGPQVLTVEKKRAGGDLFWIFLLSFCVSIGSSWILVQLRAKREESVLANAGERGYGLDDAVLRVRKDIAWIHDTLAELRIHVQKNGAKEDRHKAQDTLQGVEEELQAKQVELQEALVNRQDQEERIAQLLQGEQELKAQKSEDTRELALVQDQLLLAQANLNEALESRKELEEQISGLPQVEEQLQSSQSELQTLAAENAKLRELAEQEEYKEQLLQVQTHLDDLELKLQEAALHRERLEEQVDHLIEVEKSFIEQQREISRLTEENMKFQEQVDSLALAEEEMPMDEEIEEIVQEETKVKLVMDHGTDYLPNDVLSKWIGK